MEEKRIKSAFEIAMEKAASLPDLTPEEANKQMESEYAPRGETLAKRCLQNNIKSIDLVNELKRYQSKEADIVKKALNRALLGAITLEDYEASFKALEGIQVVNTNIDLVEIKKEFISVFQDLQGERTKINSARESLAMEKIKLLGISGSAVRLNLEDNLESTSEITQAKSQFNIKLNQLKENISRLMGL